jgi:hypothetical protein
MKRQTKVSVKAEAVRSAFIVLSLVAVCAIPFALAQRNTTNPRKSSSTSQPGSWRVHEPSGAPGSVNTVTMPAAAKLLPSSMAPNDCIPSYTLALGGSTFVPADTDVGNHCDNCSTPITLPFPVTLYDQTFTAAEVGSNGHLTFGTAYDNSGITCWPSTQGTYVLAPYWADQCTTGCGTTTCDGCGIFTTTTGTAPNRVFYVEFRTQYYNQTTDLLDYEIALYENGHPPFRYIYSHIVRAPAANDSQLVVGVKRDNITFTQAICDATGGQHTPGNITRPCRRSKCRALTASLVPCASPTPTPTTTPTATPSATPTATPSATPTPTATPSATSTPAPTRCDSGLIQNGGFETGSFPSWVIFNNENLPVVTNAEVHTGAFSAFVGDSVRGFCGFPGTETPGDSSFYQQFTVPAGGGTLSFWHWDCTTDTIDFDWQDAYITDVNGNILQTIFHQCLDTQAWVNQTVDLTPFAGQIVRIEFLVHLDDFGDLTGMFVDDVQLLVPCGTPRSTPTPRPRPTVALRPVP